MEGVTFYCCNLAEEIVVSPVAQRPKAELNWRSVESSIIISINCDLEEFATILIEKS